MTLEHAARFNVEAVMVRIADLSGPLWSDKRADILNEKYTMLQLLSHWGQPGPAYYEAQHRLRKEMEVNVDKTLFRSIGLHSDEERGVIALILWERNSPLHKEVMKLLPGGEYFYFCHPESKLEDEIDFRVNRLRQLIPVDFRWETFEKYRCRIADRSIAKAVRACKALCASQEGNRQDVTLYFDNDEDAVYGRCFV